MINVPGTFPEGPCKRYFKGLNLDTASKTTTTKKTKNTTKNKIIAVLVRISFQQLNMLVLLDAYMIMHFSCLLNVLIRNSFSQKPNTSCGPVGPTGPLSHLGLLVPLETSSS